MRDKQSLPLIWLLSDARNDAQLEQALADLPRGSGFVFRHYHLSPEARRARFDTLAALARRRGHAVVLAGTQDWGADGRYGAPERLGPGLRLALMGPHMIFGLAGGKGGMGHFYDHIGPAMEAWWETMQETPKLDASLRQKLIDGGEDEAAGRSIDQLEAERDDKLIALLKMLQAKG